METLKDVVWCILWNPDCLVLLYMSLFSVMAKCQPQKMEKEEERKKKKMTTLGDAVTSSASVAPPKVEPKKKKTK